jgi:hypothetical protein
MEDFPPEVMREADAVSEEIKELIRQYKPVFPAAEVQRKVKEFILRVLGAVFDRDPNDPQALYDIFLEMRESALEEPAALIAQTQFVDTMFRQVFDDRNMVVTDALWPGFEPPEATNTDQFKTAPVMTSKVGLKAVSDRHKVDLSAVQDEFQEATELAQISIHPSEFDGADLTDD